MLTRDAVASECSNACVSEKSIGSNPDTHSNNNDNNNNNKVLTTIQAYFHLFYNSGIFSFIFTCFYIMTHFKK